MISHKRPGVARATVFSLIYFAQKARSAFIGRDYLRQSSTPWNTPRPIVIINYRADKSIARAPARDTSNASSIRAGKNERQRKRRCKLVATDNAKKK